MLKSFAPLKILFTLKGGFTMDYKIIEKDTFTVIGVSKKFPYDNAKSEILSFGLSIIGRERATRYAECHAGGR